MWRILLTKQLTVAIDFYSMDKQILWKGMATSSCLDHTDLEQHVDE